MKLNGEDVRINLRIEDDNVIFVFGDNELSMTQTEFSAVDAVVLDQFKINVLKTIREELELHNTVDNNSVVDYKITEDDNGKTVVNFDLNTDKLNEVRNSVKDGI